MSAYITVHCFNEHCSVATGAFRSAEGLFERSPRSRPMLTLTACGNSSDCAFDTAPAAPTCTHANDVGVFCREESYRVCETGAVRLVGNAIGDTEGRLEVCINDQWGTVCDDSWDTRGANLMCQLLNYTGENRSVNFFILLVCYIRYHGHA